ncbi:MAG: ABC transporter substrate-binding protein [Deltaproteobacteria bacterium]|jgi:branched-chain amino acid transport system substrate-binding protein|nr:ABC transporter substrate-binding protein [Deltaproteobacteria bacterium]
MKKIFVAILILSLCLGLQTSALAKEKVKVAVMHSITGSLALAGGLAGQRGALVAIDMWNARGGILNKYDIVPVEADAQSSPDVAIREAERLINMEKVPVILGIYSSSIAVPLAPLCEKNKTILWITIAISDAVLKGKNLTYVFRAQPMGSQWGTSSVEFLKDNVSKLGYKNPSDIKVAVTYEDGPYGVSAKTGNLEQAKKYNMKVVLTEGYDHKTKDLSSLVLKLKAAKPDAVLNTGYYPDIVLFMRQAREMGFQTKAIIGHGAGYANFPNLEKQLPPEIVQYVYNIDGPPAQNLDRKKLTKEMGPIIDEYLKRYNEKYKEPSPPSHGTMGFGHAWLLFQTMEQAVKKYGSPTADNIRKAALEMDVAEGASPCGYGMKFAPPGHELSGQNLRSYPVVMQWFKGKVEIVWPNTVKSMEAKLPAPADWPLAVK